MVFTCLFLIVSHVVMILSDATTHNLDLSTAFQDFLKNILLWPVPYIMLVYVGCLLFSVGSLLSFHLYLISRNETTFENGDSPDTPYSKGFFANFYLALFGPQVESEFDFSKKVSVKSKWRSPFNSNRRDRLEKMSSNSM